LAENTPAGQEKDAKLWAAAMDRAKAILMEELRKDPAAIEGPLDAAMAAAIFNMETNRQIAAHSGNLVRLTRALLVATVVLSALTAILLWRTFL